MEYICHTPTFWRNRIYAPGDLYVAAPGESLQKDPGVLDPNEIPHHFSAVVQPGSSEQVPTKKAGKAAKQVDQFPDDPLTY